MKDVRIVNISPGSVVVDSIIIFRQTMTEMGFDTDALQMATNLYDVSQVHFAYFADTYFWCINP